MRTKLSASDAQRLARWLDDALEDTSRWGGNIVFDHEDVDTATPLLHVGIAQDGLIRREKWFRSL